MIEVHRNLFVGGEADEQQVRGHHGWFFIHACKEPYHRQALGYAGRAASKDHPEYLIARRDGRLILNLVFACFESLHSNRVAAYTLIAHFRQSSFIPRMPAENDEAVPQSTPLCDLLRSLAGAAEAAKIDAGAALMRRSSF